MAAGLEAAGSNQGGAMLGFAGMAMGMNTANAMGVMPNQQAPQQQPPSPQGPSQYAGAAAVTTSGWVCTCGNHMTGNAKFCSECGGKKPEEQTDQWKCSCGSKNSGGKFCNNCGKKRPVNVQCKKCGHVFDTEEPPKFCSECGEPF